MPNTNNKLGFGPILSEIVHCMNDGEISRRFEAAFEIADGHVVNFSNKVQWIFQHEMTDFMRMRLKLWVLIKPRNHGCSSTLSESNNRIVYQGLDIASNIEGDRVDKISVRWPVVSWISVHSKWHLFLFNTRSKGKNRM